MNIELIKSCACDADVVQAARVSTNSEVQQASTDLGDNDDKLIRYLMKNRHGSPFEHNYFKFRVEAPIFVFREWHRHRVGHSYNEMSGRYTELENKFYWPDSWRSQTGKPGAYTYCPLPPHASEAAFKVLERNQKACWSDYQTLLELGVAKEQARVVLPVGIYSRMYWSCNARSMMHFLGLRNKPDAQKEIRDLAAQAEDHFHLKMPETCAAFIENNRVAP